MPEIFEDKKTTERHTIEQWTYEQFLKISFTHALLYS